MNMASEITLRKIAEHAEKGTRLDVLAKMTLELQTADKFRLAAMLLDANNYKLARAVGTRACQEIQLAQLLGTPAGLARSADGPKE